MSQAALSELRDRIAGLWVVRQSRWRASAVDYSQGTSNRKRSSIKNEYSRESYPYDDARCRRDGRSGDTCVAVPLIYIRHLLRLLKSVGGYIQIGRQRPRMERKGLLVTLWMIGSFAVGAVALSPQGGAVLSFLTTFVVWALLNYRK